MFSKFFNKRNLKPKLQTADEYWQEQKDRNRQKAEFLGIDYNKELSESSFLDQDSKYKITFKGM